MCTMYTMASWRAACFSALLVVMGSAGTTATTATSLSTTNVFFPGFDQTGLLASVITAAPTATTFLVQCSSQSEFDCEVGEGVTLTQGPSTFEINVNNTDMTISEACVMSSDTASCTFNVEDGASGTESTSGLQSLYMNITITAGFEALASASSVAAAQAAAETAQITAMEIPSSTSSGNSAASTDSGKSNAAIMTAERKIGTVAAVLLIAVVAGQL